MIRPMTIDDYDAVCACCMSCTGMGLNTIDDSRDGIAKYLARNPTTCFVDERDGRITGVIIAGHDGRRGYIYHTAVSPDHRHQGIGTALVEAALHALTDEGSPRWRSSSSPATRMATRSGSGSDSHRATT